MIDTFLLKLTKFEKTGTIGEKSKLRVNKLRLFPEKNNKKKTARPILEFSLRSLLLKTQIPEN